MRKKRCRIVEQSALPFIPDAPLFDKDPTGPLNPENASKPLSFA